MGDALPAVDLGGHTATAIVTTDACSCAIVDDGRVRCWGYGGMATLGNEQSLTRGDEPGEMGVAALPTPLGTGRTAVELAGFKFDACAKLDDSTAKCWGPNGLGQEGQGDTIQRGDQPGEMGDALPPINLAGSLGFAPTSDQDANDGALDDSLTDADVAPGDDAADALAGDEVGDDTDDDPAADDQSLGCSTSRGSGSLVIAGLALAFALRRRRR